MTKNEGVADKIAAGIVHLQKDTRSGRRTLRWLAEQSGIPYPTLQFKLSKAPEKFNIGELIRIADALQVDLPSLYSDDTASSQRAKAVA